MRKTEHTDQNRIGGWSRRGLLATMGAGTAVTALGGRARPSTDAEQAPALQQARRARVRPAFGYPALSANRDPPVEPDHTVELRIDPREDRPLPDFYFEPTGLFVEPRDTVLFDVRSPDHTVTAFHPTYGFAQRIPDRAAPVNSPYLMPGMYFLYTFRVPGVWDLLCLPHVWLGMVARVVVGEASGPGAEPIPDAVPDVGGMEGPAQPPGAAATVLNDPALSPDRIVEQGRVSWDELAEESKTTPEPTTTTTEAGGTATETGDEDGATTTPAETTTEPEG